MRRSFARAIALTLAALVLPVTMIAGSATAASAKGATTTKLGSATLNASGSTFQLGYDQVVIGAFKQLQHAVTINYAGGGSGKGRQDFSDQVVDWAGTDGIFKPEDAAKAKGGAFFYFPTVIAPITVSYNLPGVKGLKLSADTIAKIFQGQIKTWDDARSRPTTPRPSCLRPRSRWRIAPTGPAPHNSSRATS